MRRAGKISVAVWVVLVILVLGSCLLPEFVTVPVEMVGTLAVGWVPYLTRTVRDVTFDPVAVWSAGACLILVMLGLHWVCAWLYRETNPAGGPRRWRMGWTAAAAGLLVLMFASGISMVALAHQVLWLVRSPEPLYRSDGGMRETAKRIKCASNMRQIGQAFLLYGNDSAGLYPPNLETLILTQDISSGVFVCPSTDDERAPGATPQEQAANLHKTTTWNRHLSYIYLAPGWRPTEGDLAARPVLCEPPENHGRQGMNILFADGHVEFIAMDEAQKVLAPFAATQPATRP